MTGPRPSSRASALVLLVGVAAVSTGALFARLAEAPALALSFWRCAVAGGLLSAWAAPRLRPELGALRRGELGLLLLSGGLLALHFASWITSLEHTSVASSVLLVNTGPIWVGLATPWLSRDRLGRGARAGIACSVVGSAAVAWGDQALSPEALWGDALALVGALSASGYLLVGRRLRARLSLPVYTGAVYGSAALVLLVAAPAAGAALAGFPAATWGWILALALVPQLVGHTAANWALGHVSAALVAVSLLGEPVLAGLGAAVVLGELPTPAFLAGSPLILAGILLTARGERGVPEAGSDPAERPGG